MKPHAKIRAYRLAHKVSTAELAKRLDIAESTLRSIENGTRKVTVELAPAIERETGVPRADFFPELFAA
jgi:transcriptional regulator with XRE-family HTH domain